MAQIKGLRYSYAEALSVSQGQASKQRQQNAAVAWDVVSQPRSHVYLR